MTNLIINVLKTEVRLGNYVLDGYLNTSEGYARFFVGTSKLPLQATQNNATRKLKALLGKDSRLLKLKVEGSRNRNYENGIALEDLTTVIVQSAKEGNAEAANIRDALVGLSLHQIFGDSFDYQMDADDRQAFLVERMNGVIVRKSFTAIVKDYIDKNRVSEVRSRWLYCNATKALLNGLGLTAGRDDKDAGTLQTIARIEDFAKVLIEKQNINPVEAVMQAIDFYS